MTSAVATIKANVPALAMNEAELVSVLQSSLYPGAKLESIKLVIGYCRAQGLDPMQKPVHIVPMWIKNPDGNGGAMRDVVMPGVNLYRTQAARSRELAGISEPEFGPSVTKTWGDLEVTFPEWCRVTVKRRLDDGSVAEFPANERWLENYATKARDSSVPNAMWQKRPFGQLAKCAEAQALRKAFPELGAAPTADEMEGKTIDTTTGEILEGTATVVSDPQAKKPEHATHTPAENASLSPASNAETDASPPASEGMKKAIRRAAGNAGRTVAEVCAALQVPSLEAPFTVTIGNSMLAWIEANKKPTNAAP
jgi:phage recombination protein Bet